MKRSHCAALLMSLLLLAVVPVSQGQEGPTKASPKADLQALVDGNNEFALDLYRRLSVREGNIIFSPYSISTALAMTYAGARGETAAQMAKVMHFTLSQERLHPTFGGLIADLTKEHKYRAYHLHVADSLWGQTLFPFRAEFLHLNQKNYGASLKRVDFLGNAEGARQAINRWVEEHTRHKIKELLHEKELTRATRLVLVNAIYFKGTWQTPFPKDQTKDAVFEVTPTQKVTVPLMAMRDRHFNYYAGDGFQWLELPYKVELRYKGGRRLSLIVLLPQKKGQLADLEKTLTAATFRQGLAKLRPHKGTNVALPRFKVTAEYRLQDHLREMGMPLAFSIGADFSGMGPRGLRISRVAHKAYIDVDEVGTEAAAATGVIMVMTLTSPFSFRADHPFLFFLCDRSTGSILFQGRVADPTR